MAESVLMPQSGSTMEEGTITRWHFQEGENVTAGKPLFEIETDKATLDVEAPADGILSRILVQEGETVPVHRPVALIGTSCEDTAPAPASPGISVPRLEDPPKAPFVSLPPPAHLSVRPLTSAPPLSFSASPRAQRIASEKGVALSVLAGRGTGPEGRIIERDVLAYLEAQAEISETAARMPARPEETPSPRLTPMAAKLADDFGIEVSDLALGLPGSRVRREDVVRHQQNVEGERESVASASSPPETETSVSRPGNTLLLSGLRKRVAENVTKSALTVPRVTLFLEVDMTECRVLREKILPDFEKAWGIRPSFTDFLLRAVAKTLLEFPLLNASLIGEEIHLHQDIHLGVAVAVEGGLIVPNLKSAQLLSLAEIAQKTKPLIERARTGKAAPEDLSGGTFTVTNLGSFGIDAFDPILVPGQSAILGIGKIQEKPAVVNGQIVPRSRMNLCLSFDHRILDGAPAAQFLQALQTLLETPVRLLV